MYFLLIVMMFGNISSDVLASAKIWPDNDPRAFSELWATLDKKPPIIVGHRGEKVLMPEHTVGSYEIAAIEGADYVEPDLVLTADGVLVCFHDLNLRLGTDVADHPEFQNRMMNFTNDAGGVTQTINNDWFIHNFTLAELQTLRVRQLIRGIRPQYFNDLFRIPTFNEYLDVIHKMTHLQNRSIGIIPELKSPKFHNSLFQPNYMETELLNTLKEYGYPIKKEDIPKCTYFNNTDIINIQCGHAIIQSFEFDTIKQLRNMTDIELLSLANIYDFESLTYDGLKEVAKVANHFHVSKEFLHTGIEAALRRYNYQYDVERIASLGGFVPPQEIVKESHDLNLKVGIYTIYDSHENSYRGCDIECEPQDKEKEMFYFFEMGVDGFFVENIQEAMTLRMKFDYNLQLEKLINSAGNLAISSSGAFSLLLPIIVNKMFF